MIKSINFQNYKAFSKGQLELKPLTILLGANSSGKSSLLQLFSLLEQTINNPEPYQSALKLNGRYINLGEDENLIKDKLNTNPLILEFNIERKKYSSLVAQYKNIIEKQIEYYDLFHTISNKEIISKEGTITDYKTIKTILEYQIKNLSHKWVEKEYVDNLNYDTSTLEDALKVFNRLQEILKNNSKLFLGYKFILNSSTKKLEIRNHYLKQGSSIILNIEHREKETKINSDLLDKSILKK